MRPLPFIAGLGVLAAAWLGPLPALAKQLFSAHMSLHVAVIAVAAPLLAVAIAGSRFDPVRSMPVLFSPVPASIVELVVVWLWHAPALHHLARHSDLMHALEQGSFLAAGLLVWLAAFGGSPVQFRARAVAAVTGLLLTSMHMTLLGVLLAVADRDLYGHAGAFGFNTLQDQQLGGVIMLSVGGVAYLAGALYRVSGLLREIRDAVSAD